jgi:hypothetical protein
MKTVSWFSTGASSFIATYLLLDEIDEIIYIHIDDQHEDSMRYLKDCEKILDREIKVMQSEFKDVDNTCRYHAFVSSAYGAKCTEVLKKKVRIRWEYDQQDDLCYVWGFDCDESHRADRLLNAMPKWKHRFPLIEKQLLKEDVHGMCAEMGLKRPVMYDMGYNNNNCIGCIKGGMGYWNKIRLDFPDVFKLRSEMEREIGHSCLRKDGEMVFLDELAPDAGRGNIEILEDCGIMCQLALNE